MVLSDILIRELCLDLDGYISNCSLSGELNYNQLDKQYCEIKEIPVHFEFFPFSNT